MAGPLPGARSNQAQLASVLGNWVHRDSLGSSYREMCMLDSGVQ
jgi:hypothetical protein